VLDGSAEMMQRRELYPAQSISRNTVFSLLVQATTTVFTAATTLFLIRRLGTESFGTFALALGISGIAGLVARCGIPTSVSRFVAENRDDPVGSAALLRDALGLIIVTAALASSALFLAAEPIARAYSDPGLAWPIRGIAISLFAESVLALYLSLFIALARIAVNLRVVFLESAAEATASIALVAAGTGAAGAAFGRAIGYTVGVAVAVGIALTLFGRVSLVARGGSYPRRRRAILRYAAPLFALDTIYGLLSRLDLLLIGAFLNTTSVGLYGAPRRLMPMLESLALAVANSVAPRQATSSAGRSVQAFTRALRWLVLVYAALLAPLIVWAGQIVELLFGADYAESASVLRLLTPFVFLNGISPLVSTTVNFLGYAGRRVPIALAALAVNVGIDVALLPRIGEDAAAIGMSAAFCVYVPAHLYICRRALGFSLRPLATSAFRALTAAAAMAGVLALTVRVVEFSIGTAALGLAAGLLVYAAVLVATREIALTDVGRARRVVGLWLRRRTT
jgi:O-antigen/teichoic acid export membrane protein